MLARLAMRSGFRFRQGERAVAVRNIASLWLRNVDECSRRGAVVVRPFPRKTVFRTGPAMFGQQVALEFEDKPIPVRFKRTPGADEVPEPCNPESCQQRVRMPEASGPVRHVVKGSSCGWLPLRMRRRPGPVTRSGRLPSSDRGRGSTAGGQPLERVAGGPAGSSKPAARKAARRRLRRGAVRRRARLPTGWTTRPARKLLHPYPAADDQEAPRFPSRHE